MGMHKSASTGSGMNMAFAARGTGAGMGMSSSQSTSSSLGDSIGPIPKADPFADLGRRHLHCFHIGFLKSSCCMFTVKW